MGIYPTVWLARIKVYRQLGQTLCYKLPNAGIVARMGHNSVIDKHIE